MEYTLTMTFLTESGEKAAFTLAGVKNNVSESEVQALMDSIIENNIFYNKKGAYVSKQSAQVTGKEITKFEV